MGKKEKIFLVFAIIATIGFLAWSGVRIVKSVQFDTNCKQYIKRAADANTIETAKDELSKAISYAEENNLTQGVVSIFLHQPKNDIGYWYNNMKESYEELENLSEDASPLEKTNVLMKLRETLTDDKEEGITVTVPDGIDVYPNNKAFFWWGWISFILAAAFWILKEVACECWD
jgi:hypothetical protein